MNFEGKTGLVLGVANKRSIAWAIAKRLAEGGARLAFTYQGERIEENVRQRPCDRPGDRALVGHAQNESLLAFEPPTHAGASVR